jgi:hypothetical protein
MNLELKDKAAIVTGGTQGIGVRRTAARYICGVFPGGA